ncbi:MAG: ATP-binding protein, partial [Ferruginibacter sp.]
ERVQDCIDKGLAWDEELEITTHKGNNKWVRTIGEGEFVNGKCVKVYGSFQDINARKEAEREALKAYEEKNIILESIGDAFFAIDKHWVVTYWNNQAEKMLMLSKTEMVGAPLWDKFSHNTDAYKKYHRAVANKQVIHFEDYYKPLDKWYGISAYPSDNGLSVYFKDITEKKIAEQKLKDLNNELEESVKQLVLSNAELEQFAYVASHDLQEPLRMVTSFLLQIEKKYAGVLDDKGKRYIHFAMDGAKRMKQIILDLLEFSLVGQVDDKLETVDMNELLNEVLGLLRKKIEEKKAIIKIGRLPVLKTFKPPLLQVFQNLLSNSLKYHSKEDAVKIVVSVKENENNWEFSVSDNGIGIAPEYFDKIFTIFQRLHNKDEYSGTGIGLAISKKIIENMGGNIWVESEEGKGSTFYFTLLK